MAEHEYLDCGANFSPCSRYRYRLWRTWDETRPPIAFIGLNPSTADATRDDPTIRRCTGFASSHGYGTLVMLNLFAWRSTDPRALASSPREGEAENEHWLDVERERCPAMVAAWGANALAAEQASRLDLDRWGLLCLGTTKHGHPRHPLYVRATQSLGPWKPEEPSRG